MKKKAVVGLILAVVFTITACGGKKAPVNQQAQAQPVPAQPAQPAQSAPDRPSDEELQEMLEIAQEVEAEASEYEQQQPTAAEQQQSAPSPEPDRSDPMWMFKVNKEDVFAQSIEQLYIKKGDDFYRVCGDIYNNAIFHSEKNSAGETVLCSFGAPVLTFRPGDELVCVSSHSLPELHLNKMSIKGTTLPIFWNEMLGKGIYDYINPEHNFVSGSSTQIVIQDSAGTEVLDYTDLKSDEQYKVSFIMGTQVKEFTGMANCAVFHFDSGEERAVNRNNADYIIQGTPTTEGYAVYDISSLPSGFYEVGWNIFLIL